MSFQTLPDDILLGILQHASWTKHYRENFKQQLYILGIFQRLRAIALPKIYNNMYIDYDEEAYKRETHVKQYSKPFTGYIHTNASIIALANCAHMVITAKITVKCLSVTCDELQNTLGALQACSAIWPNINKLELYMSYNAYSCSTEAHSTLFPRMCKKYSHKLANIMPSVTELLLVNWYINISLCEFYGNVADAYANQLIKLTSKHGFDFTGSHKFEAMQYLYINMSRNNKSLPSVNSHTLVDLHIGDISFNVSWAPFMINKVVTVIDFLCLKRLSLEFNCRENTEENMPEVLLNFPELSSLTIVCNAALSFLQDGKVSRQDECY